MKIENLPQGAKFAPFCSGVASLILDLELQSAAFKCPADLSYEAQLARKRFEQRVFLQPLSFVVVLSDVFFVQGSHSVCD
jgi:hypothetical protein